RASPMPSRPAPLPPVMGRTPTTMAAVVSATGRILLETACAPLPCETHRGLTPASRDEPPWPAPTPAAPQYCVPGIGGDLCLEYLADADASLRPIGSLACLCLSADCGIYP